MDSVDMNSQVRQAFGEVRSAAASGPQAIRDTTYMLHAKITEAVRAFQAGNLSNDDLKSVYTSLMGNFSFLEQGCVAKALDGTGFIDDGDGLKLLGETIRGLIPDEVTEIDAESASQVGSRPIFMQEPEERLTISPETQALLCKFQEGGLSATLDTIAKREDTQPILLERKVEIQTFSGSQWISPKIAMRGNPTLHVPSEVNRVRLLFKTAIQLHGKRGGESSAKKAIAELDALIENLKMRDDRDLVEEARYWDQYTELLRLNQHLVGFSSPPPTTLEEGKKQHPEMPVGPTGHPSSTPPALLSDLFPEKAKKTGWLPTLLSWTRCS